MACIKQMTAMHSEAKDNTDAHWYARSVYSQEKWANCIENLMIIKSLNKIIKSL